MKRKIIGAMCLMALIPTMVLSPTHQVYAAQKDVAEVVEKDAQQSTDKRLRGIFENMDIGNLLHLNLDELEKVIVKTSDKVNVNLKDVDIDIAIDLIKVTINVNQKEK